VVVLSSVNTNNIAVLSACFSASAARSCGLVSLDGVLLMDSTQWEDTDCEDEDIYFGNKSDTQKSKFSSNMRLRK
jgi:hypothetical protein